MPPVPELGVILPPLFAMAPILLRLADFLPANGDPLLLPIIVGFAIFQMFSSAQALVTGGALIADMADEHELETGRRQEGIFFGAQAFITKALYGLGVTIAGIGLGAIGMLLTHIAISLGYNVVVAELVESKVKKAVEMGASFVKGGKSLEETLKIYESVFDEDEVVTVFECAGSKKSAS